jgi:hypothetical protein
MVAPFISWSFELPVDAPEPAALWGDPGGDNIPTTVLSEFSNLSSDSQGVMPYVNSSATSVSESTPWPKSRPVYPSPLTSVSAPLLTQLAQLASLDS